MSENDSAPPPTLTRLSAITDVVRSTAPKCLLDVAGIIHEPWQPWICGGNELLVPSSIFFRWRDIEARWQWDWKGEAGSSRCRNWAVYAFLPATHALPAIFREDCVRYALPMHGDQLVHQLHAFLKIGLFALALAPFLLDVFLLVERFAVGLGVLVS